VLWKQYDFSVQFCFNTGMEINLDKTVIILFRNGGRLCNPESWSFRGQPVNITTVYRYMGLLLTPQLSWNIAHDKLSFTSPEGKFCHQRL
jgi:hypothetical protein